MRRTALVVCIIAAASLAAEGQGRPGIFRPGRTRPPATQPATAGPEASSTPAPAPAARESSGQASPQGYKPAIEYQSLMELRFYENQGNFLVEGLEVVFPPAGSKKATFVVTRGNGAAVASVPLRLEAPLASFTMFGMYVPDGVPGNANVGEPGDYVLSVQVDGRPITTLPFSMKRESNNDPFNPKTAFVREGPWRDLAYFSQQVDEPNAHLEFNWGRACGSCPPACRRGRWSRSTSCAARRRWPRRGARSSSRRPTGSSSTRSSTSPPRSRCGG